MNKNTNNIIELPIEDLEANKYQPRIVFNESELKELATSIKNHGIIQPIICRKVNNKYEIIAGERRYRAAKLAGLSKVSVILTELDEKDSREIAVLENVQRKSLTPIEEAKSYKALLDEGLMDQQELAQTIGVAQEVISNKLRLLSLDESVQDALLNQKISEGHAKILLKLENLEKQKEYVNQIIEKRLTVKQLDDELKELTSNIDLSKPIDLSSIVNFKIPTTKKTYPNKFFNFLESESANMNFEEEKIEEIELDDFEEVNPVVEDLYNYAKKYNDIDIQTKKTNGAHVIVIKIPD